LASDQEAAEEARLKALAERIRRNPCVAGVDWAKQMRKELLRVRPEERAVFFDNLGGRCGRRRFCLKKGRRGRFNERS
jgi:hypothetical protein